MIDLDDATTLALIKAEKEIVSARKKFPNNTHLLAALMEEVGELAQAMLQFKYEPYKGVSRDDVKKEAIQVACVAIRIVTEGDATFEDPGPPGGSWDERGSVPQEN